MSAENLTDVTVSVGKMESGLNELLSKLATMVDPKMITREPPVDIFDNGDTVAILVDLPGAKKDSIKVRVSSNYVEVFAEPQPTPIIGKAAKIERLSNFRLYRKIELSVRLKVDGARATYKDGVLQIIIPKLGSIGETEISIE